MTFKQVCYIFIKSILLCFLLSSCQTPKYSKVTDFSNSKNILPEVQYSLTDNFNPNNINCIAIGKITDESNENEFNKLDNKVLEKKNYPFDFKKALIFKNVNFSFLKTKKEIFRNFNFF